MHSINIRLFRSIYIIYNPFQVSHLSSARPELQVQLNGVEVSSLLCVDQRMNMGQSGRSTESSLVKEMFSHYQNDEYDLKKKQFPCSICGKRFGRLSHVQRHQSVHTGEKPYQCDVCQERFTRLENRARHMATHAQVCNPFDFVVIVVFLMLNIKTILHSMYMNILLLHYDRSKFDRV